MCEVQKKVGCKEKAKKGWAQFSLNKKWGFSEHRKEGTAVNDVTMYVVISC